MAEYIERRKVSNACYAVFEDVVKHPRKLTAEEVRQTLLRFEKAINSVPAADVAPVRHGKWEWREEWETHPETHSCDLISCGWYCAECGIELGDYLSKKIGQHIILDDDCAKPKLASCPHCGAYMRGGNNEE